MSEMTPEQDILANILNDSHSGAVRGLDELRKLIHAVSPAVKSPVALSEPLSTKRGTPKKKRKKRTKRKTTHYLDEDVFDNLGEAKKLIKDYLPAGSKRMATKSQIVESAIKVLLTEFDENGEDSYLVRELLKKKAQRKER